MLYPKSNFKRDVYNLNGIWNMKFVDDDYKPVDYAIDCIPMAVPASYNDIVTKIEQKKYSGKVLFERDFSIPLREDKIYRLRIGATSHKCEVYLNGEKIGDGINGFYPIDLPINRFCEFYRLTVIIDNRLTVHTLPSGHFVNGQQEIQQDFYNFCGIHRDVLVYSLPEKHIEDIFINTAVDGDYKKVSVDVKGYSDNALFTVFNQEGKKVVETNKSIFYIEEPVLWNVGKPYLYKLAVRTDYDYYEETFGIRKVEVVGDKFLLNDTPVYFKGCGMHEDFFVIGKANNSAVSLRNLECLKWLGANSFRTSHYPYSEEMMDLADRYGFMVIDEAPAVGMVREKSFGEGGADHITLALHKELMKQLYERDKNHPCVVMVSVSNEPETTEEEGEKYFREVFDYTRTFWKLPLTFVDSAYSPKLRQGQIYTEENRLSQFVDVLCINKYIGWYSNHSRLEVIGEKLTEDLTAFYEKHHKPVILAEFGADTIEGLHSLPAETFSEEYQALYLLEVCKTLDKLPWCIGEHVWNFADFKTKETVHRVRGNRKGIFTKDRQPKMSAHVIKNRWENM